MTGIELPKPKLIALFGPTGTGKTTFVNDASGGELKVGKGLESCTRLVACSPVFQVDGQDVVLIDTPGFDNTEVPDTEILKRIAGFLVATYEKGYKLTGVIYLHRITDNRMGGVSRRNFHMFRRLCGEKTLSNVLIVTNKWSDPPTDQEIQFQQELKDNPRFFQPAIQAGARMLRRLHMGPASAHEIIRELLDKPPVVLEVQRQLVDNQQNFYTTDTAKVLGKELSTSEQCRQEDAKQLEEELRIAREEHDLQTQTELQANVDDARAESLQFAKEMESLNSGHGAEEERLLWEQKVNEAEEARRNTEIKLQELRVQLEELRRQAERATGQELTVIQRMMAEIAITIAGIMMSYRQPGCILM